ncbi:MAG: hypothetical protein COT74_13415 [Bdellovibrionales bacterium CG10_big_fil_rev_8_21_14_0_10_45_34]|nr:MAG: hypothetical protein COT74_13415 [Bdellovibrionales bacterium CG10_big_fil_rev_8_21_14_0_10_45_34]
MNIFTSSLESLRRGSQRAFGGVLALLILSSFSVAHSVPLIPEWMRIQLEQNDANNRLSDFLFSFRDVGEYQVGSIWSRFAVNDQNISSLSEAGQRAAKASVKISGATGFYLGKFNGEHVIATNHHVWEAYGSCPTVESVDVFVRRVSVTFQTIAFNRPEKTHYF